MPVPLDLDEMERGSLSSTARRLIAELRRTRKERDEALEKVHFYEVQYQDEIGINGLIEERDAALAAIRREERRASLTDAADWLRRYGHPDAADQMLREVAGDWDWPPANCGAERRDLFIDGEFTAHSGDALPFKIDCDALTDGDIATLAAEISRRVQFASVMEIPRGGLRLAAALERYRDLSQSTKGVLIVDDVLTTGRSMAEARKGLGSNVKGAVIFARGPCSDWITPLFTMGSGPERQALDEAVRALSKISGGYIEAGTNHDATQEYATQIVAAIRKLVPNAGGENA